MSKESIEWLNTMTLQGFTEKRGNAWHYLQSAQGVESNSYPLAIPVEDVRRRLFSWKPISVPVTAAVPESTVMDESGVTTTPGFTIVDTDRQAIVKPAWNGQPASILGVFKSGFVVHDYSEWLTSKVDTILGGGLAIGSAGLLKGGAVAWVQVETPETVEHKSGVAFRPFVTATTSLDGSLSTTYLAGNKLVICDNTLSAALGDSGALRIKIKHSRHSLSKIGSIQDALGLVQTQAEDFGAVLDDLTSDVVTDAELAAFLDSYVTMTDDKGETKTGRALTMAENKRDGLTHLINHDNRVSPWKGTAFGVLQMANTYEQHEGIIRGQMGRAERNSMEFLRGSVDKLDASVLDLLSKVRVSA
jgi:phage/plasmid-like protein (TIGR03299 family)